MSRILIIGATSAIAQAAARRWAADGAELYLLARDEERLAAVAADLLVRGAKQAHTAVMDAAKPDGHERLIAEAAAKLGHVDVALVAYGTLPDQQACAADFAEALRQLHVNALSVLGLLSCLANLMEQRGAGTLAAIGSVAGDRGRQSNYVYGSAKGAVAIFMQGLRQRLAKSGVRVLTIKPGFVDTPMTREFKKGLLWAKPDKVGADIVDAVARGREVVYTPWFWRYIMLAIRLVPERLFKKISL